MKMSIFGSPLFLKSWNKIYGLDKDLPLRLAYKAKLINDYLMDQEKKFSELRQSIFNKYATKDTSGNPLVENDMVQFPPESVSEVNKAFADLMDVDLAPECPATLKVEELEKAGIKLSGPDISILGNLLDFSEDSK